MGGGRKYGPLVKRKKEEGIVNTGVGEEGCYCK